MRLMFLLLLVVPLVHAESRLSGTVVSAKGEKISGVTVSAKAGTITTSVFTDKAGNFQFSPLPEGSYRVWAQTLGYQTARTALDLSGDRQLDLKLARNSDAEQTFRQLPGNLALDSLPEASDDDKRMKQLVRNGCTSCHTASYPLQHRFDEAGWSAILELMKNANVYGSYMAKERGKAT
ncbi:MAG: carboxypeptidase regulatory-like domain-containing protein, partial [Acidobacteria bacterium]|nr:carboxypeptidase regulatory-like domain-containing protein [Acidobacteriota bacterium]